jgi:hypothetical protein
MCPIAEYQRIFSIDIPASTYGHSQPCMLSNTYFNQRPRLHPRPNGRRCRDQVGIFIYLYNYMLRVICVKAAADLDAHTSHRASSPWSVLANIPALPCMHVRLSPFSPGRFCKAYSLVASGCGAVYAEL